MGEMSVAQVVGAVEEMQLALEAPEVEVMTETALGRCDSSEQTTVDELLKEMVEEVTLSEPHPSKKLKEDADMDLDENNVLFSTENKENMLQGLKRMTRKELEDLVLVKILEALVKNSEAGKFRNKMLEMQMHKDKMQQRVTHLQKQVVEMGKAVKLLLDNHNRDPNNLNQNKKRPPPIKFYRSVGLQVTIEPNFRNGPTKVIHVSNTNGTPINGLKPLNATNAQNIQANANPPPMKRPGPKSLTQPNAKLHNGLPQAVSQGLTKMNGHLASASSPIKSPAKISSPTVVDLTDDTATTTSAANPVQYTLLTTNMPAGYQLVTAANGQRLLMAQQNVANTTSTTTSGARPMQAIMLRNLAPRPSVVNSAGQPRPAAVVYNRSITPAATIPNRSPVAIVRVPQQPQQQQPTVTVNNKKIQLPPCPSPVQVTVPRGRVLKELPPKPTLTLNEQTDGIVLSWTMKLSLQNAEIASYQIYACQESLVTSPGKVSSWKKVGDVKALPLPMACTLSQFISGNRYFFIVRAIDTHGRSGPFCDAGPIILQKKTN